jgi:hypothetical protein
MYKYFLLPRIFSRPIRILFERVTIQHAPNVATATWVFVVIPCPADTRALLYNDEVVTLVALDEVDRHTHA